VFLQGCFKDTLPATVYNIGGSLFDRVDFGRVSFRGLCFYMGALKTPPPTTAYNIGGSPFRGPLSRGSILGGALSTRVLYRHPI
jgi:hypothetical protein